MTEVLPPRPDEDRPAEDRGSVDVRLAVLADLADPSIVGTESQYATELRSWMEAQKRGDAAVFVATYDEALAGRVTLGLNDPRKAWISSLMVTPHMRRRGIARALMLYANDHAYRLGYAQINLAVGKRNHAALLLYRSLGYRRIGTRRTQGLKADSGSWVHEPEDAWELSLQLDD